MARGPHEAQDASGPGPERRRSPRTASITPRVPTPGRALYCTTMVYDVVLGYGWLPAVFAHHRAEPGGPRILRSAATLGVAEEIAREWLEGRG